MKDLAALHRALGDETRLRMIWLLMNHSELCVCDFMEILGCPQSRASRHLRYLYHAGIVEDRRQGLWIYYRLRKPASAQVAGSLKTLRQAFSALEEAETLLEKAAAGLGKSRDSCRPPQGARSRNAQQ